jgi:hypothetical protein
MHDNSLSQVTLEQMKGMPLAKHLSWYTSTTAEVLALVVSAPSILYHQVCVIFTLLVFHPHNL